MSATIKEKMIGFGVDVVRRMAIRTVRTRKCWNWVGDSNGNGYGRIQMMGKRYLAHRVAYELSTGKDIKKGFVVHHKCNNKLCVNPRHLVETTPSRNTIEYYNGAA